MADYLTSADLLGRFDADDEAAYLTGDGDSGVPDPVKVAEAIDAGESYVNIRLAKRYETPVSSSDATTTAAVKRLALDAADFFYRRRKRPGLSDDTLKMKEDLDVELKALADGEFPLPGAAVPTSTTSVEEAAWLPGNRELADDSDRLFTRGTAARL